MAKRSWHVE